MSSIKGQVIVQRQRLVEQLVFLAARCGGWLKVEFKRCKKSSYFKFKRGRVIVRIRSSDHAGGWRGNPSRCIGIRYDRLCNALPEAIYRLAGGVIQIIRRSSEYLPWWFSINSWAVISGSF